MNPNADQALEDEEAGIQETEDDTDWDAVYGGVDVPNVSKEKSKDLQNSYAKIFKDVLKQGAKETLIGIGGAYGDLQSLLGENDTQKKKNLEEHETLKKFDQPGYQPTAADIASLSDDSETPRSLNLPTSEDLRGVNEAIGGPGDPETDPGKYAARSGNLYGSGLAFGQVNPVPAAAAGIAGQAVEDLGYGPLAQAAAEIATLVLSHGKGRPISGGTKEIQKKIDDLRKLGYAEEDITLAVNAAYKNGKRVKNASKGAATEQAFEDFATKSDQLVGDILSGEVPGIEKGSKFVHEMASDAYGQVVTEASKLNIKNLNPFFDSMHKTLEQVKKSVGHSADAKAFVQELTDHTLDIISNPSAENMIDFYKRLNGLGKWVGRNQKDRMISGVKDSIKDTFRSEGKQGRQLADNFEKVNKGIQKAYKAEDVSDLIQKATTQEGIDYKKLNKIFDKKDNIDLLKDVLGETQTKNLKLIANTGKEIKDFDKSWKTANAFRAGTGVDVLRGAAAGYYIFHGDWEGLAKVAATKIPVAAARKLAEKSLTDPKFQNILIKGIHAVKNASPQLMKSAQENLNKYLDEEGIDIPLE